MAKISALTSGAPAVNATDFVVIARSGANYKLSLAELKAIAAVTSGSITGITDLAVADGGTGASTAQAAAQGLGVTKIIAKSGTAVSGAADTNENILATITLPANAMGANGILRLYMYFTVNNDASTKTFRVRIGGIGGTIIMSRDLASQTGARITLNTANVNATNVQYSEAFGSVDSGSLISGTVGTASAVDTTASTTLVITAQKADGTDTMTLRFFTCEVLSDGA